ncbi:MAG: UPF0280 family protein [Lentisphaeria bacterium]|nr:UPF0280 family protein [Lentisphaeria bacterium]
MPSPEFKLFSHREANFRIRSDRFDACVERIIRCRRELDAHIASHPAFKTALSPLPSAPAPAFITRMYEASQAVGVGPMAAVAGAVAEAAAWAAVAAGASEAIVENGGDIFIVGDKEVRLGLFAGTSPLSGKLALRASPGLFPLAVCSSSSTMGHSLSLGKCDLATVFSRDACLADCAATQAANLVKTREDIQSVLDAVSAIPGIDGLLIIKGDSIGMTGRVPPLARNADAELERKITRHSGAPLPRVVV